MRLEWFVNVQDTARLHISGLLDRSVISERIFGFAKPFNWTDVLDVLRGEEGEEGKDGNLPVAPENEARDLSEVVPSRRAEELLVKSWGREGWVGLRESVLA